MSGAGSASSRNEEGIRLSGCDLEVPPMGLGTWAWGDRRTWGLGGYDRSYDRETIREAYQRSVEKGVTFLDTAEAYGRGESERIIGDLLEADSANRDRIVIATKFMPLPWKLALESEIRRSLDASLERLGLPFVHLYQIHGPISLRSAEAMANALAAVVEAGLVRAVGVSNYSEQEMRAIHAALASHGIPLATNQIEYSLLRTMPERNGLLSACAELGAKVLAYSPLGQGRLTGKYSAGHPPPGRRGFSDFPMAEVTPLVEELRRIGQLHGDKSPSQVALNWVISKGAIPIPGAKNREQADQNAGALGWRLSSEEVQSLDRLGKYGRRRLIHRIWQHG